MQKVLQERNQRFYYSPLRYPGGKAFLSPFFNNIITDNDLKKITYIEPFAGGSGAALTLLMSKKVDRIVINDLDKAIYSFWKSAIFESEKFIKKIKSISITIKEWRKQKAIYNDLKDDEFRLGFATFFLNRTNVSGILSGGPIGGMKQLGKYKIDARFNKDKLIQRINQLALYKDRISVFNKDGLSLINNYLNKKNVLIYLDPPYFEKGASLYLNHYKKEDHEALAKKLNDNPNAFWLLTYDNKKEIKSLYSNRRIINFSLNYNVYKPRIGKELMILSDVFVC